MLVDKEHRKRRRRGGLLSSGGRWQKMTVKKKVEALPCQGKPALGDRRCAIGWKHRNDRQIGKPPVKITVAQAMACHIQEEG